MTKLQLYVKSNTIGLCFATKAERDTLWTLLGEHQNCAEQFGERTIRFDPAKAKGSFRVPLEAETIQVLSDKPTPPPKPKPPETAVIPTAPAPIEPVAMIPAQPPALVAGDPPSQPPLSSPTISIPQVSSLTTSVPRVTEQQLVDAVLAKPGRAADLADRLGVIKETVEQLITPTGRVYKGQAGWLAVRPLPQ